TLSSDDVRSTLPRFKQEAMAANMKLVDVIQNFAKTKDVTNAQIALAWLLAQDESITPIPGTTKIQRIRENIDAEKVILSPTELKDLTEAADSVKIVGNRYNEELARGAGN
ncbi:aldo/keto reductase, partial [Leuconostoc mesenteroides]